MKLTPEMVGFRESHEPNNLPKMAGVYIACNKCVPVYVGQSVNLFKRGRWHGFTAGYISGRYIGTESLVIRFAIVPKKYLTMVEKAMIEHYRPELNKNFNPDWRTNG